MHRPRLLDAGNRLSRLATEWFDCKQVFKRSQPSRSATNLKLEALEPRQMLAADASILFIGGQAGPTQGADPAVMTFLESTYGAANVTYRQASATVAGDESAFDVLVISSTPGSGSMRGKFQNSTTGILNWEEAIMDAGGGEFGLSSAQITKSITTTQMTIAQDHPITAGLSGTVDYVSAGAETLSTSDLFAGLTSLTVAADGVRSIGGGVAGSVVGQPMIFVAEAGQNVNPASGASPAAGRRVMFPMSDVTFNFITDDGKQLFENSIDWLANKGEVSPPLVTNGNITSVAATSAVFGGDVVDTGGQFPTVTLYYGTSDGGNNPAAWDQTLSAGGQGGTFSTPLAGLSENTTYFVTARAANSAGESWATPAVSFTTATLSLPQVVAEVAGAITSSSAELAGEITDTGGDLPNVTLYYGTADGGTIAGNWDTSVALGGQSGAFETTLTLLDPQTNYFYRFSAENDAGTVWTTPVSLFSTLSQSLDDVAMFNDHVGGGLTDPNTTNYAANGTASGQLKNSATGEQTGVILTTTGVGINFAGASAFPFAGTDADTIFGGKVDFTAAGGASLEIAGADSYTHTFSGLEAGKTYDFAGTAIRGNAAYTNRWTLVTLVGADAFTPAHSSGVGIVTAGLAANQVALWVGHNSGAGQGFVAQWTDIDPGADGRFEIVQTQYTGPTPGVGTGTANGSKGYGLSAIRLTERFTQLGVLSSDPPNGAGLLTAPTVATINFNLPVKVTSLDPSDLTIDGQPATGFTVIDPDTVRFDLPAGLGAGEHSMRIAAGAIESTDDLTLVGFSSTFTILIAPSVENLAASGVGGTLATIGANLTDDGGEVAEIKLYWGTSDGGTNPASWENEIAFGSGPAGQYERSLSGLGPSTEYFYRGWAQNSAGDIWAASTASVTTSIVTVPTVSSGSASDIGAFSAIAGGNVTSTGGDVPTVIVYYGETDGGEIAAAWDQSVAVGPQAGAFDAALSGLTAETSYFFRVRAENAAGIGWATNSSTFTTVEVPALRITEFLASNNNGLDTPGWLTTRTRAGTGDAFAGGQTTPDWIEIRNFTPMPLNIGGFYLTDDRDEPAQWAIPVGTVIPASGYLVIFASGLDITDPAFDEQGLLHTNFSLQEGGEYLALSGADGTVVHEFSPKFPKQFTDTSFGVNDLDEERFYDTPTPGADNNESSAFTDFVRDTQFSFDRGIFDPTVQSIETVLSTSTPGATIVYTTDGSLPTLSIGTQIVAADAFTAPSATLQFSNTTTLRAAAFKTGLRSTNVDTQTYIFLADTISQPVSPAGFPTSWPGVAADYQMDPQIAADPRVVEGLTQIPSLSLVAEFDDLFGSGGLYLNPGSSQERPTSAELIFPDGSAGFQIDAGARMQGGASRAAVHKKHSMSLRFRDIYGDGDLKFPVFDGSPVERFDSLHLRARYNNSWIHWDQNQRNRGSMIREMWMRDSMSDMGDIAAGQGRFVHLYLNGLYWGVYELQERQEASHQAAYFGGNEEDYDARNGAKIVDGTSAAWNELLGIVSSGKWTPDGNGDSIQERMDIDNFIDYWIINQYGHNNDLKDNGNWRAAGGGPDRTPYRMYTWDAERTLENPFNNGTVNDPTKLLAPLRNIQEFVVRFGDRLYEHFFNDGALTPENTAQRWMGFAGQIDTAIVAESARWGDARQSNDLTYAGQWIPEQNRLINTYFPVRSDQVLGTYRSQGLYPSIVAPSFGQHGGEVPDGFSLPVTAPTGTIYYTTDGSDPRLEGGAINPDALVVSGSIPLIETGTVNARVRSGGSWSALNSAFFTVESPLRINEVHFNPSGNLDAGEFLELLNISDVSTVDLTGVVIGGVGNYEFLAGDANLTLGPGERLVVASDLASFAAAHPGFPAERLAARPYSGSLANGGETLTLTDAGGGLIQQFTYDDAWYKEADGDGFSLVVIDTEGDYNVAENWRSSALAGGSPGVADMTPAAGDFNGSGSTDRGDLVKQLSQFGRTANSHRGRGDMNGDGMTGLADAGLLQSSFASVATPAPSPSAAAAALLVDVRSDKGESVELRASLSGETSQRRSLTASRQEASVVRARITGRSADRFFAGATDLPTRTIAQSELRSRRAGRRETRAHLADRLLSQDFS